MKQYKSKDNFMKEKILERNSRIENFVVNYLSTKNGYDIPYNNDNQIYVPLLKNVTKISNSRPKISRVHPRKKVKVISPNSFNHTHINNNITNNIKNYCNNTNNIDSEDALTIATRKTMASISQQKENKENININSSYATSTYGTSNNNINNIKNNSNSVCQIKDIKNKKKYFININNETMWNPNYFSKKNHLLTYKNSKKIFNKMNNSLSTNSRVINRSYARLNINLTENNNIINDINNTTIEEKINFNNSFLNNHRLRNSREEDISRLEKSKTIDVSKPIRRNNKNININTNKNPTLYTLNSNNINNNNLNNKLNNSMNNYIYNKKNNFSSFSHEKMERKKTQKEIMCVNNKEKYEKMFLTEVNLEDFLLIIQKFENIKSLVTLLPEKIKDVKQLMAVMSSIKIKIRDLFRFYGGCTFEGTPENLFISKRAKINLHYYSIVLILSLGLMYIIVNKVKMTQEYFPQMINLFNFQQKLFLLLSDMVIHKIKINDDQKMWVREIMNILNNKLMFNTENFILEMKKIIVNSYYLMNEILVELKIKKESGKIELNEQEIFFMNFFLRNNLNSLFKYNMNYIEELFNNNVFVLNATSSSLNKYTKNVNINKNKYNDDIIEIIIPQLDNGTNNIKEITPKAPYLRFPIKKQFTLILDLDETLIHFKLINPNKRIGNIKLRPGLINFLEIIKEFYEIIIFTSGTKEYADAILNSIEKKGNNKYFDGRLYRNHNIEIGQKYYKDLSKIGRDLSKTIIVDNFNYCFKLQRENGILISSYYGDNKEDKALIELQKILIKIYNEKCDVRQSIIKYKEEIFRKVSSFNKFLI